MERQKGRRVSIWLWHWRGLRTGLLLASQGGRQGLLRRSISLARMYELGVGLAQSRQEAIHWYRPAARGAYSILAREALKRLQSVCAVSGVEGRSVTIVERQGDLGRTERVEPSAAAAPSDVARLQEPLLAAPNKARASWRLNLPSALAKDYEIVEELPAKGGEADILVTRLLATGEKAVAKVYRRDIKPKPEVLEQLIEADPTFIIRLLAYGESDGVWYELQEYAQEGSLADLLSARGKLSPDEVKSTVVNLSRALACLHGLQPCIVHRDLKPSNVLIRRLEPLETALADFGVAVNVDFSRRHTTAHRTIFYAPPEGEAGEASPQFDWWSLGMTAAELLTGRHPFTGLSEAEVEASLRRGDPVDLQAIWATPQLRRPVDWARLCRGLLQFKRERRWGANETARLLAGETVLLPPEDEEWTQTGVRATPKLKRGVQPVARPYVLKETESCTLRELGQALAKHWDEAVKRVGRRRDIERWLENDLGDHDALNVFLDIVETPEASPEQQLGYFASCSLPVPVLRFAVDDGVRKICLQAHVGVPEAQLALAKLLLSGTFGRPDVARAATLAGAAAKSGVAVADALCAEIENHRSLAAAAGSWRSRQAIRIVADLCQRLGDCARRG